MIRRPQPPAKRRSPRDEGVGGGFTRAAEVARGWHGWRATVRDVDLRVPPAAVLADVSTDGGWDRSRPLTTHAFLA